jgi:eukaryotic-like serine/threonine-protein kinase
VSAEGRLIAGRYRLQQRIGSGAMGVVWRAVDERLHRTVAVKQLLLQPGYTDEETEEARQRSMREGRIAARLQHHNAIVVFDVAEDEGQPVLVMEYLPSKSLATVLTEQGPLPPQTVAGIGAQVAGALAAAHQAGIVHRDLKPGNILLGDNGVAKITDFGISRAIGDVSVTKSGILAGTPAYLAPEVALGRDPAPASDVFSLGSTLYAAIEGGPPFGVDENAISLLHRVARGQVEPPRHAGPMTPALMLLLQPDPVDRPTMLAASAALQAVVDGRPVPGAPTAAAWQPPPLLGTKTRATSIEQSGGSKAATPVPTAASTRAPAAGNRGRTGRMVLVWWAVAIVVAIAIGVLAANAYGRPATKRQGQPEGQHTSATASASAPTTTPATTTKTETPTASTSARERATTQPTPQEEVQAVRSYYSLVPGQLNQAWSMLGPFEQARAGGRASYDAFWNSIASVQIVGEPKAAKSRVLVGLRFVTRDGRMSQELHALDMIAPNGTPLINNDTLVGG